MAKAENSRVPLAKGLWAVPDALGEQLTGVMQTEEIFERVEELIKTVEKMVMQKEKDNKGTDCATTCAASDATRPQGPGNAPCDRVPFLYELEGSIPIALSYTIKRLMRGLVSLSEVTRSNCSCALMALLTEFSKSLPNKLVLSWFDRILSRETLADGAWISAGEESRLRFGMLLAIRILLQAHKTDGILELLMGKLLELWKKGGLLQRSVLIILGDMLMPGRVDPASIPMSMLRSFVEREPFSANLVALILTLRHQGKLDLMHANLISIISQSDISMEKGSHDDKEMHKDRIDYLTLIGTGQLLRLLKGKPSKSAHTSDTLPVLWYALVDALVGEGRWETLRWYWSEVIRTTINKSREMPTVAYLDLLSHLIRRVASSSPKELIPLLEQQMVDHLVLYAKTRKRDISKRAQDLLDRLGKMFAQRMDWLAFWVLRVANADEDLAVCAGLFEKLQPDVFLAMLDVIEKKICGGKRKDGDKDDLPDGGAVPIQVRIGDLILLLFKTPKRFALMQDLQVPLAMIKLYLLLLSNENCPAIREQMAQRLQSILAQIIPSDTHLYSLIGREKCLAFCFECIDSLFDLSQKEGLARFERLDEPVRDAWQEVHHLSKLIPSDEFKNSVPVETVKEAIRQALHLLLLFSRLLLLVDPICAAPIIPDLIMIHQKISRDERPKSKKQAKKDKDEETKDPSPLVVLVEILLQWLSRPSSLLRKLADEIFTMVAPFITEECCESIFKVLSSPITAEMEDLMEGEDDDADAEDGEMDNDEGEEEKEEKERKKDKIQSVKNNNHHQDTDSEEEEEPIKLEEAEMEDLDKLDIQLARVFSHRKGTQSTMDKVQTILNFKQRLCHWLLILCQELPSKQTTILNRIRMASSLFELCRLLDNVLTKKNASLPTASHLIADRSVADRILALFTKFYSHNAGNFPQQQQKQQAPSPSDTTLTIDQLEVCSREVRRIVEITCMHQANPTHLKRAAIVISYLWQFLQQQSSLPNKLNDGHALLMELFDPLWKRILQEGAKKHNFDFMAFFKELHIRSVLLHLLAQEETLNALSKARPYTRKQTYAHACSILKQISPSSSPIDLHYAHLFCQAVAKDYLRLFTASPITSLSALAEEMNLLGGVILASKRFMDGQQVKDTWQPLYDVLVGLPSQLQGKNDEQKIQPNQLASFKSRINNIASFMNCQQTPSSTKHEQKATKKRARLTPNQTTISVA